MDGIQIHGAHLSLVALFLSDKFNRRTDEYGGNDENRARFLVEIIQKIKKEMGDEFIISITIYCEGKDDTVNESGYYVAGKLAAEAGTDLIVVSGNNFKEKNGWSVVFAPKNLLRWLKFQFL